MRKKALLSFLLAALLLFFTVSFSFGAMMQLGDVNNNGVVSADDARQVLRYAVGLDIPTKAQKTLADVNRDNVISAEDARLTLRIAVGLNSVIYADVDMDSPKPPERAESSKAPGFKEELYKVSHNFYDSTKGYGASFSDKRFTRKSVIDPIYGTAGKWCCFYSIHDVFRPALRNAGYSEADIDKLAPIFYSKNTISTAISNIAASENGDFKPVLERLSKITDSPLFRADVVPFYIPSVLMNYYRYAPSDVCTTYTVHEYYDDVIEDKLITPDTDARNYTPKVGDVIFMSNKKETYAHGYPTVDHTAQIIEVYEDGTFLCTEGSIIEKSNPDNMPRVRERRYKYNSSKGTFIYEKNSIVIVLACVRPAL